MRLLVCGDRYWSDREYVYSILDYYLSSSARKNDPIEYIIEGEAVGADEMAGDWAQSKGVPILTREPWINIRPTRLTSRAVNNGAVRGFPALWGVHGRAAGPIRNKEMLDVGKPTYGLAFHNDIENSSGTKGMIKLLQKAGIMTAIMAPDKLIQQKDFGFIIDDKI